MNARARGAVATGARKRNDAAHPHMAPVAPDLNAVALSFKMWRTQLRCPGSPHPSDRAVRPHRGAINSLTHHAGIQDAALPADAVPERGIRWFLRDATAARHAAVDALGGAHRLDDAGGYRRFLRAHARALMPVEQALEAGGIGGLLPDWAARSRRAALSADLERLGEPLPPPVPVRLPDNDAARLGAAYVLEGSRFGNGMLARQVADALPRDYLAHRASWPAFLAALETRLADRARWPDAAAGALAAFDAFQAALSAEQPQGAGHD